MEREAYLLAVDQGTSGTMVALLDTKAQMVDAVDIPVSVSTPHYSFVEQDPQELIRSIREGAQKLMAAHPDKLDALLGAGFANQGESFLLWDWETGEPVTPVISWQDGRCEAPCQQLVDQGKDQWFDQRTGLHLSSEWPALKLRWLRENEAGLKKLWDAGRLAYGQLDAWFLYALTGGRCYASDHSTACRSGLCNLRTLDWDQELIAGFGAEGLRLPPLCDNTAQFEGVDLGIGKRLPWVAGGLDQSMALLGQRCIAPHTAKVTYGTCCACWMNMGDEVVLDDHLTTSVAWKAGQSPVYALAAEGGAAGSIVTWLQRNFKPEWKTGQLSNLARECGEDSAVVFVPAFNGLGAPYWTCCGSRDAVRHHCRHCACSYPAGGAGCGGLHGEGYPQRHAPLQGPGGRRRDVRQRIPHGKTGQCAGPAGALPGKPGGDHHWRGVSHVLEPGAVSIFGGDPSVLPGPQDRTRPGGCEGLCPVEAGSECDHRLL